MLFTINKKAVNFFLFSTEVLDYLTPNKKSSRFRERFLFS